MSLANISAISFFYGDQLVLEEVTLKIDSGEKIGLIGPNGSGKTTLLKIISGELKPERGSVYLARGSTVGYLPQQPDLEAAGTLREYLEKPLRHLFLLREELTDLEKKMESCSKETSPAQLSALLEKYGQVAARFEAGGGYSAESKVRAVAMGLGFKEADLSGELQRFSGGEKTRARLAALLLQQPDLLLLDEPTNFLDLEGVEWLERYLQDTAVALIVVSHDRHFLDKITGRILALQSGRLKSYSGNYSVYLKLLEQERLELERAYQKRQALVEREERLIRESKIDQRSKRQARSRQKRLAKLETAQRPDEVERFKLGFGYSGRSGRQVICFDGVDKSFGSKALFKDLSFEINRGDRVAVVGPNGAGKSTLLKLIAAEELPDKGAIRLGAAVSVTYFSQEQECLLPERTLLEEITASADMDQKQARQHLGAYLFRGDEVFKQIKYLSGGERCRLALARLALNGGNCLLMDEPTSHLDLPAVEELEKALQSYPGTLIVVSHDRYFLQKLANRILELNSGSAIFYEGELREYLERRSAAQMRPDSSERQEDPRQELKKARLGEQRLRQERRRAENRLRSDQSELEERIAAQEAAVERLEKSLDDPEHYGDYIRLLALNGEMEAQKEQLCALLKRWEEIGLLLEQAAAEKT